jgi:RNase adapter protein RapZ
MTDELRLVIITGMSGSGKTTAHRALEDLGFFCVDNLPPGLLSRFLDLHAEGGQGIHKFAFVMDTRERDFLRELPRVLEDVQERGCRLDVVFLDCGDDELVRRFSETRRPHPAAHGGTVLEGIQNERRSLAPLKDRATIVIDTAPYTVHDLRREIQARFSRPGERPILTVQVLSFGFKHGVPREADLMIDVRFLPNPFFEPGLREKRGLDPEVQEYVLGHDATREFVTRFSEMIDFLLPYYEKEGKSYLTIAVGCTGGHHRSVAIAEELARRIMTTGSLRLRVRHRDLEK